MNILYWLCSFLKKFTQFERVSLPDEIVSISQAEKISNEGINFLMSLNNCDYEIYEHAVWLESGTVPRADGHWPNAASNDPINRTILTAA